MGKNRIKTLILGIIVVIIGTIIFNLFFPLHVGTFSVYDYRDIVYEDPYCNVGHINNRFEAVNAARQVWHDTYGDSLNKYHIDVYYDSDNECWFMDGFIWEGYFTQCNPFYGYAGGGADVIITSDGDVVAIWRQF